MQGAYFTYVLRPSEAPEGRGPRWRPFWDTLLTYNLRIGFGIQLAAWFATCICALAGGNVGLQLVHLYLGCPKVANKVPLPLCVVLNLLWIAGSLSINCFRQVVDDDCSVKQSRGYRAGSKALNAATLLDVISLGMATTLFYSMYAYFEDTWTTEVIGSGSTKIFGLAARIINALAIALYGGAIFCLEAYHVEGTQECWGWIIGMGFKSLGALEILVLATTPLPRISYMLDVGFSLGLGIMLLLALSWSLVFEPVAHHREVKTTQSALRSECFKSRHAMQYYARPPLDITDPMPPQQ
eukprot:GHVO01030334.1.p1 GENE.GHVO01030334.1~~GHVO01030334.1.p1  ORF type:complete len:333 (+),score=37.73 GHVO01030334.1:110-1000(+)